jgi:hypothetical protein
MISIPTSSITLSTLKFGFCNSISAFWYEHIIIFPKTWGKQLYTICILSFCCLSSSNAKTQDVMLASTQETLLISDSIIGTFFNHQKDSCIHWPAMLWTVEAIGYKLVFTDISVWLYNCLHIPELLAISHFITRVLDYKIGLLLSTRHNLHHQVKWHCLKSIGEEMWMMRRAPTSALTQ